MTLIRGPHPPTLTVTKRFAENLAEFTPVCTPTPVRSRKNPTGKKREEPMSVLVTSELQAVED